jgi:hypothetical protein
MYTITIRRRVICFKEKCYKRRTGNKMGLPEGAHSNDQQESEWRDGSGVAQLFQPTGTNPSDESGIRGCSTAIGLMGYSSIVALSGSGDVEVPGLLVCLGARKDGQKGVAKVVVIIDREILRAPHVFGHDIVLQEVGGSYFARLVDSVKDVVAVFPKMPCKRVGRA